MKCMKAIKDRIARPAYQLENHLSRASIPHTVYQPGKSSVRDLQGPSSHHSSMVFRNDKTVAHHSDDSVGLFRHTHQSPNHNVALNQLVNQPSDWINYATYPSLLVPDAIPKTLRFKLSKRRRVAPITGSSNQQLVTQLEQFLTMQQLIAIHFSSQHQNIDQHVSLSRSFSQLRACCQQQPHQAQLLPADSFFKRNYCFKFHQL
ncbi:hypothetical protein F511_22823 [Dorcoceras hygrometricum]|uniref:Uncharacterized protein n=1 Tax=Dorcoceras hygrometricum TaxID=472368 RepID=A0A2Z7BDA1_9LAMI|nr:hypothetical protein F511_22823 [Dorcoceras hygrometricum]